jgi:hypothetical protein
VRPGLPDGRCSPERRSVGGRPVIHAAKAAVPTIDLADRLCGPGQMRRIGTRWTARCPLPGHEDKSPSFVVFVETNSWYCFGACQRGGDVIDLARIARSIHRADVAAAEVLMAFGHEVPQRPRSWFDRQARQAPIRDALEELRVRHVQRRLFRLFAYELAMIVDDRERQEEKALVWENLEAIAVMIVAGRRQA